MSTPAIHGRFPRRIGIFGGTFNPPHNGHIALAEAFLEQAKVDEVWMMVSPQNPFKTHQQLLDDAMRLEMVRRAVSGRARLVASDYEFSLPRPSYTYHTLCRLREEHPDCTFSLLIGGDNWVNFHRWFRGEEVIRMAPLYVYPRVGQRMEADLPANVHELAAPLVDISSTQVRQYVARGKDISGLVPPEVAAYIEAHHLYAPSL